MNQEILAVKDISEGIRSVLLQMNANALKSIQIACGEDTSGPSFDYCTDELKKVDVSRQEILEMENISEGTKSVLLQMNSNTRRAVEVTVGFVCK